MWWWLANLVWVALVIPLVLFLLYRLRRPVEAIRRYARDVEEHAAGFADRLEEIEGLLATRDEVLRLEDGLRRYSRALDDVG